MVFRVETFSFVVSKPLYKPVSQLVNEFGNKFRKLRLFGSHDSA